MWHCYRDVTLRWCDIYLSRFEMSHVMSHIMKRHEREKMTNQMHGWPQSACSDHIHTDEFLLRSKNEWLLFWQRQFSCSSFLSFDLKCWAWYSLLVRNFGVAYIVAYVVFSLGRLWKVGLIWCQVGIHSHSRRHS